MKSSIFVGREDELRRMASILEVVRTGATAIAHIHGPAGIGKTALLERFVALHCAQSVVLRAMGDPIEESIPFSVLGQLVSSTPGTHDIKDLASTISESDVVAIGSHLVQLLGNISVESTTVLVLDDAQWCDLGTLEALAFALRRLHDDPVLVLVATRTDEPDRIPPAVARVCASHAAHQLPLSGLEPGDLADLASVERARVSSQSISRIHEHTQGNPLFARAMLEQLDTDELLSTSPIRPLPAPTQFAQQVIERLRGLNAQVQDVALALAVLGIDATVDDVLATARVDNPSVLNELLESQLVRQTGDGSRLRFTHPLVRSAVYQSARVDECAELHLRAAAMIRDRVLSLQHRLAAANGPDEQLAAELYQLGWQQMQQGNAGAVESFRAAARLAQSAALREQAMVDAFECSMMAGDVEGVSAAAVQLQTDAGPWQRYVEGCLALVSGDPKHADMVLTEVWNRTDSPEPLRARAACQLAVYHVNEGRPEAVLWAKRGVEVPASELPPWLTPATCLSLALAEAGRADEALDFARHARPETLDIRTSDTLAGRGIVKKWTDDLDGARTDLLASFENYRRLGSTALSLLALYHLAEAEYRAGAWDISITHGELAVSLMEDMNHLWVAAQAHSVAAMPLAGRGLYDEARAHVQAASQHAAMRRDPASALYCATADALVAHARREFDAVVRALEPLQLLDHVLGMDEPGIQPWHALLADAFIELGRIDEAEAVVAGLEAVARPRERQTALHAAAAARARIAHARGERDAADGAFQHAALLAADLPVPFARAQFELAYGRFLRRTKRRAAAVTVLRAARDRFTQLGAKPYLDQCEQELTALGAGNTRHDARPPLVLTPQETAVAELVAKGMTNREVAAELVISVKTVEYHLGKVYAKLDVTTRTQLAQRLTSGVR